MFERYTERARRVVFFARYEASQFGDREIGDVHLLLGLLREDMGLLYRLLSKPTESGTDKQGTIDGLRRKIEDQIGPPRPGVATSVDIPLASSSKRILAYAAEEADRTNQRHIGSEHLLLGILRERGCLAASILNNEGIELAAAREAIGVSSAFAAGAAYGSEVLSPTSPKRSERSARLVVLEFVCDGQRIVASVVALAVSVIPRAGEQVIIKSKEGEQLSYRVEDVSYIYEPFPPDMVVAPHQLTKVLVRLSGPQES